MILAVIFITFAVTITIAVPLAFGMGFSALLALLADGRLSPMVMVQKVFSGMDSLPLLAIPFFMIAGLLMEQGGISRRLVKFAGSLVGHFPGGLSMVTVLSSMIFAGVSGSSAADTAAIGSILMPEMVKKGYKKGFVATLQACAGTIGPIIPPSILMIIYCSITGLSVGAMFLAGFIPGILIGIALMIVAYLFAKKEGMKPEGGTSIKNIATSFIDAFWALLMPILIIGGILSGIFTATEAGMVAVIYSFFVGLFIYRELKWDKIIGLLSEALQTSASLMFIAGMASIFGWILAREQFPVKVVGFLLSLSTNPPMVMFIIIVFFLILGCFVETLSAMIIFVPVLAPIAAQFGFDPIHFALIIIVTLLIGQVTPPVGTLTFITCSMLNIQIKETLRFMPPFVGSMIVITLILAYTEPLVMFIPRLFFH